MATETGTPGAANAAGGASGNETEKGLLMQGVIVGGILVLIVIAILLGAL